MIYFNLINQFLYYTLALATTGGTLAALQKYRKKIDKLASNELKDYKELREISGVDGLNISKNFTLSKEKDNEGICLIGPTGAGKTTGLFLNNLLREDLRGSFIVTDPKGEIYELTSGFQNKVCKRKVYRINLINPDYSERYNLLEQCSSSEEVIQLASDLLMNGALSIELSTGKKTGGVEWIQMSEPLLSAALLYAKDQAKPFNTIEFALQLLITLDTKRFYHLIKYSKNIDAYTQFKIFSQVAGADRTEGSIKITLASNLKLFTDRTVNKISSSTTFDINKFREEESILYISYQERKSSYLAPFIAPLFSQLMDKLLNNYSSKSLPIKFLFEEYGNIGMLNNMSINAATVRSRKISLVTCLQSITQLYQVYGVNNAKAILNNLKTKLLLPGISDIETINYISNLCGTKEINVKNYNYSNGKESHSISKTKRKIFEDGEIRTLKDKTVLIVSGNKQPVIDELNFYFETDKKDRVMEPIKYKKASLEYLNISREVERQKEEIDIKLFNEMSNKKEMNKNARKEKDSAAVRAGEITAEIFG